MHRCEFTTTKTGIVIGGAHTKPPKPMTVDEEVFQALLLKRQRNASLRGYAEVIVTWAAVAAFLAAMIWGK